MLDRSPMNSEKEMLNRPDFKTQMYNTLYQGTWMQNHPGMIAFTFLIRIFENIYTIIITFLIIYYIYIKCRNRKIINKTRQMDNNYKTTTV